MELAVNSTESCYSKNRNLVEVEEFVKLVFTKVILVEY